MHFGIYIYLQSEMHSEGGISTTKLHIYICTINLLGFMLVAILIKGVFKLLFFEMATLCSFDSEYPLFSNAMLEENLS